CARDAYGGGFDFW
nr:immunoglobulin heavy chain junction region [Macaca mulatta]MOV56606.1 immunoglobulin heavy chain junction region [Macaca mulatta]MOV56682.1 immunoglobulin heavy chain junction region [Macaca mulatta]MOV58747.1 immunoglobulin heavy chain junction region [Macaca mulatta]MOV59479.1 immunoglobulin heavy chain junction region [Macaca mulatta]